MIRALGFAQLPPRRIGLVLEQMDSLGHGSSGLVGSRPLGVKYLVHRRKHPLDPSDRFIAGLVDCRTLARRGPVGVA